MRARGRQSLSAWSKTSRKPESLKEGGLRRVELLPRLRKGKPLGPVHLGKLAPLARARWPLHLKGVAAQDRRVEVALGGPAQDPLAALQSHPAQLLEPLGDETERGADLLLQLAQRAGPRLLPFVQFTLRDRPGAL